MPQLRPIHPESSSFPRRIGIVLLVIAFLAFYRIFIYAHPSTKMLLDWDSDWDFAAADAKFLKKPRLVLFYEYSSKGFKEYEKNVLSNAEIVARLKEELILVKVDITNKKELGPKRAKDYQIRMTPTLVVLYPDRQYTGQRSEPYMGIRTPDDVVRWSLYQARKR
jgi:hypothetical protein